MLAGCTPTEGSAAFASAFVAEVGLEAPTFADGAFVFHRGDDLAHAAPGQRTLEAA